MFVQNYDPLNNFALSVFCAALPLIILLYLLALHPGKDSQGRSKLGVDARFATVSAAVIAIIIAVGVFRMPLNQAFLAWFLGALIGLYPICWIVITVLFLYAMTVISGSFDVMRHSIMKITQDKRVQVLIVAFGFGAFLEGAAGFGTPVAVCAAILVGMGIAPLEAALLCLLGDTAPVAFGGVGIPMIIMGSVTGLPVNDMTAMVGRILPFFSFIIPFWIMFTYVILLEKKSMSDLFEVFPAAFVSGISFALTQYFLAQHLGPQLIDILAGIVSILCLAIFLRFWSPKNVWVADWAKNATKDYSVGETFYAWVPWLILVVIIIMWGTPSISKVLGSMLVFKFPMEGLNGFVTKIPPVVPKPTVLKDAVFVLPLLSATGTGILFAAILSGLWLKLSPAQWGESFTITFNRMKAPFIVVPSIVGIAFLYKYAGMDVQLALAFASTGSAFPFFSSMLGYLGVFLTGSDTSSNALFGNLQKITAEQLKINPILSTALNSAGGVMGKMISPQSIVVALAATFTDRKVAEESFGPLFRSALIHSFLLAILVGLVGLMYAYVFPNLIPVVGK